MVYLNNVNYSQNTLGIFYTAWSQDTLLLDYSRQMQLF